MERHVRGRRTNGDATRRRLCPRFSWLKRIAIRTFSMKLKSVLTLRGIDTPFILGGGWRDVVHAWVGG